MGVWSLVFSGSTPIGSLQAKLNEGHWGAPATLQVGVVIMTLAGLVVFRESHQQRRAAAQDAPPRRARA